MPHNNLMHAEPPTARFLRSHDHSGGPVIIDVIRLSQHKGYTIATEYSCPKCRGRMEEGFILDRSIEASRPSFWIAGSWSPPKLDFNPERYMARLGEIFSRLAEGKSRRSIGIRVRSMRCVECGYLESYAADASDRESNPNSPDE